MSSGMNLAALLDPRILADDGSGDDDDESSSDPRRKMLRMMNLSALQSLGSGSKNVSSGGGGGAADPLAAMSGADASADGIVPSGFDSAGNPTEFPATATKQTAADRLKRADTTLHPTGDDKIKRMLAIGAPALIGLLAKNGAGAAGAVQGAAEGAATNREHMVQERNFAAGQYQFEAGQEEKQREAAIRERLAMSTLEANRAYRTLTASIAEQKAKTGEVNSETNAAGKGLTIVKGDDGVKKVVPLAPDQLSEINKARIGVQQATEELSNAKAKAIPEQIEIQKKRLGIQQQMLQKALAQLGLQQERVGMQREALDFRESGPTSSSRTMAQTANVTEPHVRDMMSLIKEADAKGYIGPVAGRVYGDFLAGKVGSTGDKEADTLLGMILEQESLMSGAISRTHMGGRAAEGVWNKFQNDLRMGQAPEVLLSRLSTFDDYVVQYGKMDEFTPIHGGATQGSAASAAAKLKRGQGSARTGNSRGVMPPPGAKIRHYSQLSQQPDAGGI